MNDAPVNMERRTGLRHWFADVGYIYVLVAVLVSVVLALSGLPSTRHIVASPPANPVHEVPGPAQGH